MTHRITKRGNSCLALPPGTAQHKDALFEVTKDSKIGQKPPTSNGSKLDLYDKATLDTRLTHLDCRVLWRLVHWFNPERNKGWQYHAYADLAAEVGAHPESVRKCIGKLVRIGYVSKREQRQKGRGYACYYSLILRSRVLQPGIHRDNMRNREVSAPGLEKPGATIQEAGCQDPPISLKESFNNPLNEIEAASPPNGGGSNSEGDDGKEKVVKKDCLQGVTVEGESLKPLGLAIGSAVADKSKAAEKAAGEVRKKLAAKVGWLVLMAAETVDGEGHADAVEAVKCMAKELRVDWQPPETPDHATRLVRIQPSLDKLTAAMDRVMDAQKAVSRAA